LILRQSLDDAEYLAHRLLLFEIGCDVNLRFTQGCHSSLLLSCIEGQIAANRVEPLRQVSVQVRGFFPAQPEEGFLHDLAGGFQIPDNPAGVSDQGTFVKFQCLDDPSGFRRVAHAAFNRDNGVRDAFLDTANKIPARNILDNPSDNSGVDTFERWLIALEQRHLRELSFQEVRRSVQALSSLYVERRPRLPHGSAPLDGAGKRAAFAMFFAPLHFLLVREIIRHLLPDAVPAVPLLDLGCGTGAAGAAWASRMASRTLVTGVDRHPWAVQEARWTYGCFGLDARARTADITTLKPPPNTSIVAAFVINELPDEARRRWQRLLLETIRSGNSVLVVEPVARRVVPWWEGWSTEWIAAGGRADEWRFPAALPARLALMGKAAGLDHRELKGRSLWFPGDQPALAGRQ
jgi:hypothetical protein